MALVQITDVIVPTVFDPYMRLNTMANWNLLQSGAIVNSPEIEEKLRGGGSTFEIPFWDDLDGTSAEEIGTDDATLATPAKIGTHQDTLVRLTRNKAFSWARLASDLAGSSAADRIAERVAVYWQRRFQALFISIMTGIFADNDAAPAGSDTHTQGDLTYDASGSAYQEGVTTVSATHMIDALGTMGDRDSEIALVMAHSTVRNRMRKENLIEVVRDSDSGIEIETYMGKTLIVNDNMPNASGVYDTWLFGRGAVRFGAIPPTDNLGTEIYREPLKGTGSGVDNLITRWSACMHPTGHRYVGAASGGGPANTVLDDAASWSRRAPERKQIRIARLKTRESA